MTKNILKTLTITTGFALATVVSAHAASSALDKAPSIKADTSSYVQVADGHKGSQKGEEMKDKAKGSQKGEEKKEEATGSQKGEKKGSYK